MTEHAKITTKQQLAERLGISARTRAKLMNKLFYPELQKLGYNKDSIILNSKVVNFMLNELLSIDYENRTELH